MTRLTPNQLALLRLLRPGALTAAGLAARWPARSTEGITRTAASLAALGLVREHADGWAIVGAGRKTRTTTPQEGSNEAQNQRVSAARRP